MSTKLNVDSIINESIKLEKLNEDVINTINNIAETKASDAVTPVANDVDTLIGDHVIGKGSAENSAVLKGGNNTVTGNYSAAIGYGNTVNNNSSVAFGYNNKVKANCCFSDGSNNEVSGENSHVGGRECIVEGHESYAEGNYTKVYGHCSHGEGTSCRVLGDNSHVEGLSSVVYGHISHAEGQFCAAGDLDQVDKISDERTDYGCHAEGIRTTAKEMASHSEGMDTHAMGIASHSEGRGSYTSGDASHAEGLNTKAGVKGFYFKGIDIKNKKIYLSTTKPDKIKTSGFTSSDFENIDFPYDIEADMLSIINGNIYYDCLKVTQIKNKSVIYVESLPFTSVAEFNELFKNSNYTIFCLAKYKLGAVSVSFGCHSEGYETRSFGFGSHSDGYNTIAKNVGEHASGIYNVSNSDTQFSIGIGTSDTDRKNAFEVKQNGDIYAYNYKLATGCINVTHEELVNLRKNNRLIPGQQYRITDYQTVSNQKDTIADGRRFDIIVVADDESTLNENARAIHHDGCDDFKDDNLAAWELKYTLTNDDYLYHWGNSGDIIESDYTDLYSEYQILSINGDKIEYGYDYGDGEIESYGTYTVYKNKTYMINGQSYYRISEASSYYVEVGYKTGDFVYYKEESCEIAPSVVTDEKITDRGYDYYKLSRYDYYVRSDYATNMGIYYWIDYFDSTYDILSINGDIIEFGWNSEVIGTATIDKRQTFTINGEEYYSTLEHSFYYVPVNYGVGGILYYYEGMSEYVEITSITNAPSTKGVIYYMKDEFNNECAYDFKSIRFLDSGSSYYTFGSRCMNNVIRPYYSENSYLLNFIILGNNCNNNVFGNNCYNNIFGNNCYNNVFGNNCYNNIFGSSCYNNIFGSSCYNNFFGSSCYNNFFGSSCHNNFFGNNCTRNIFGNYCYGNSFGTWCEYNSFGNSCRVNSFGNYCCSNSFGNYCCSNSFRLDASTTDTLLEYCYYNHFDDGCSYNVIWNSVQPNYTNKLQNINVVRGVSGTSSAYNFINIVEKNANHEIKVAKNTNGKIKIYCEADLTKLLSSLDSDGCLTLYHE